MEAGSEIDHVYFIITGRVECVLFDRLGKAIYRDVLERGSVVGLFSVLLSEPSRLQAKAVEPTIVLLLALDELLRLSAKHREFQLAMFRVAANVVKQLNVIDFRSGLHHDFARLQSRGFRRGAHILNDFVWELASPVQSLEFNAEAMLVKTHVSQRATTCRSWFPCGGPDVIS